MYNFIKTNSNLILIKINKIIEKSILKKKKNKCNICSTIFNHIYKFKYKNFKLLIKESDIHLLKKHNIINNNLYNKICEIKLPFNDINYCILNTNGINIIDGLYEEGSKQIYIQHNKNINDSKIIRFSEHSGFIYFKNNKLNKIIVLNESRTEKNDPLIYLPENTLEALNVDYIFHTHPKTPYIGARSSLGIIYEFPSISDILHFIEHHNNGKLLGSIIISPEGIYIIHKFNFNRDIIKLDYDLFIDDIEEIYKMCYYETTIKYNNFVNSVSEKINSEQLNFFYSNISQNFDYINFINNTLSNYDLYIDYYPRINLENTKNWIFPNIYVPII